MAHYYVRQIADPTKILSFGHTTPGQYQYDPAIYEEAQGALPVGWSMVNLGYNQSLAEVSPEYLVHAGKFGIIGDGVTDNSPALQEAIEYTISLCTPEHKATLLVPNGHYLLSKPLEIIGPLNLVGEGNTVFHRI